MRGLARGGLVVAALGAAAPDDGAAASEWPLTRALEVARALPDQVTRVRTPSGELAQHVSRAVMDLGQELAEADLGVYTEVHEGVLVVRVTEGPADRTLDEVLRGLELDLAERERLVEFFRARIEAARTAAPGGGAAGAGAEAMVDTLTTAFDYRAWQVFDLLQEQGGTRERLTRKRHAVGSGGEQAVLIHLPLFAAAAALYDDTPAPRMIYLDEALSGIDDDTRGRVLGATVDFGLDLVMIYRSRVPASMITVQPSARVSWSTRRSQRARRSPRCWPPAPSGWPTSLRGCRRWTSSTCFPPSRSSNVPCSRRGSSLATRTCSTRTRRSNASSAACSTASTACRAGAPSAPSGVTGAWKPTGSRRRCSRSISVPRRTRRSARPSRHCTAAMWC